MSRTYRDKAIVLRSYKLGEADRIMVMLGENTGPIRAVAKGVRRVGSRIGGRLAAFNLVDVQLYRGRNLDTVTQVQTLAAYSDALSRNYAAFTNAKLVAETAQKISEGAQEPQPEQFRLLHGALHALVDDSRPAPLIGAAYLLRAMDLEGWRPALRECVACEQSVGLTWFGAEGGAYCEGCTPSDAVKVSPEVLQLMSHLVDASWDAALAADHNSWERAHDLAGAWGQWHLEQRLSSLPFATAGAGSDH